MRLIHGDCLDALRTLPDCTVDAVVTDPPAGIAFMGKAWDGDKGGRDQWIAWLAERLAECLRVLKPGGHAVVWALPRTSGWTHRALEDAGFDVRDCVHHLFGSGFPKSLDVGKAIDKQRDDRADILRVTTWLAKARDVAGLANRDIDEAFGFAGMAGHWTTRLSQPAVPTWDQWLRLRDLLGFGDEMDVEVWRLNGRKGTPGEAWDQREVIGSGKSGPAAVAFARERSCSYDVTAPATPAAQQWSGWGTALKPAVEHWWLARKPLDSTVAGTVTRWGTGALNIDACRVAGEVPSVPQPSFNTTGHVYNMKTGVGRNGTMSQAPAGRWPADVVLSHSAECNGVCSPGCAVAELDRQAPSVGSFLTPGKTYQAGRNVSVYSADTPHTTSAHDVPSGASRFFPTFRYQAKPSTREKSNGLDDRNTHPTVKPVELMRWLVRLVIPPGGTVLDPFAGSGSTLVAATLEGFDSIGVEAEAEYLPLIEGRVRWAEQQAEQPALTFD